MRLVNLEVKNWRGFGNTRLEFNEGITIVGGPNESGKTSLRMALRSALLVPTHAHKETKLIEAHRPWQTKLNPKVKLHFTLANEACVVEKEFLRKKDWASLTRAGRLIAEDGEVQPELMKLLGPISDWIDVLWGVQGEVILNRPAPESLKGKLAAAAQDTVLPQVIELHGLIADEYDKYWTPKSGKPTKSTQEVRNRTMELEALLQKAEAALIDADAREEKLAIGQADLEQRKANLTKTQREWQDVQQSLGAWETYNRIIGEALQAETAAKQLEQWIKTWNELLTRVRNLVPKSQKWIEAEKLLNPIISVVPSRTSGDTLLMRQKFVTLLVESKRYAELQSVTLPTPDELRSLKNLEEELRNIYAALKASEIRAKITAEKPLKFSLSNDASSTEERTLASGVSDAWSSEERFELNLPGVARLEVSSGNPLIAKDRLRKSQAESELFKALKLWKSESVEELQKRILEREARLKQIHQVDPTQLSSAAAAVTDSIELTSCSITELENILSELPGEIAQAESIWSEAQKDHDVKLSEYKELMKENPCAELKAVTESLRTHWQSGIFPKDSKTVVPETITESWLATAAEYAVSPSNLLSKHQKQAQELPQTAARPEGAEVSKDLQDKLQLEIAASTKIVEDVSSVVNQEIGAIKAQGDLYAKKVLAEETLAKNQAEEHRITIDAQAIREMSQAFEIARAQLQKGVVAPLQDRVSSYFSNMTGGFYKGATFDSTLVLNTVATSAVSEIALDDVSFGTREQLSLLTRLCLAELLSEDNLRQVVILDDNLVHSDDSRMQLACKLLEAAAKTVQIVIFTCHPERYSHITSAHSVALMGKEAAAQST
jgi:recombinational DNA repair ATPase RecF